MRPERTVQRLLAGIESAIIRYSRGLGMRISAVVPLYNGGAFIEAALRSVAQQWRPADEIIVVDDGSTDDSAKIVEGLSQSIPLVLIRKENGGQGSARNLAVKRSSADLIAFLDQDDIWYPHHLEELEKPFLEPRSTPPAYAYADLDRIDVHGNIILERALHVYPDGKSHHPKRTLYDCLSQDMYVLPGASLISRAAFDRVGGFDEQLTGYEDDDLFLRLFSIGGDAVFIDKPLTQWRLHSGSTSYSVKMSRSRMRFLNKLLARYPDRADVFASRFFGITVADSLRAILRGTGHDLIPLYIDALKSMYPHIMGARRKALTALLIAIMSKPALLSLVRTARGGIEPLLLRRYEF